MEITKRKVLWSGIIALMLVMSVAVIAYQFRIVTTASVLSCAETDAGFDIYNQGSNWGVLNDTNMTTFNVTDNCFSGTELNEFVCGNSHGINGTAYWLQVNCTAYSGPPNASNYSGICVNGACV